MAGHLLYRLLQVIAFWAAVFYMVRSERRRAAPSVEDSAELDQQSKEAIRRGLLAGLVFGWALGFLPIGRWHSPWIFWTGIGVMFAGLWFRQWAIRELGRAFSIVVTVHEEQQLVRTGPYRILRHPTYTGALIWFLGVGLTFGNLPGLAAAVGFPLLIGYRRRIRIEEAVLQAAWGDAYREYMRRTYRLVPFVW